MKADRQHGTPFYLPAGAEPGAAQRMERAAFERGESKNEIRNERWVQKLIQLHPELLPIDEIEPAYAPVIPVCMELPTPCGRIDNVFITPDGNLIFAETKLYRNPEARREVVAQVMDYAENLTGWTFEAFQKAISGGKMPDKAQQPPDSLFSLVEHGATLGESSFIDAVARNLRLGRGLFLIVGDGIREETETLAAHVQAHAGLHFALALVELACFLLPDGGRIIHPRTVVRTTNIERGIVRVENGQAVVSASAERSGESASGSKAEARTLSGSQFYEQLAKVDPDMSVRLEKFTARLEPLGIEARFGQGLILRWSAGGKTWFNLGYVDKKGMFWITHTRACPV